MIITRKIKLTFNEPDKEKRIAHWESLRAWMRMVRNAANQTMTHLYIQDNIKEFFYLTEELQLKLANVSSNENGMFNTSHPNTIYRLLSDKYKGEMPMAIASALGMGITKVYKTEKTDVWKGKRSIRNYKRNIPIPIPFQMFSSWGKGKYNNYSFVIFKLPFITFFGRDRSGNRIIMERALSGEYKFCDSSILIDDKDPKKPQIYLLLTVDIPKTSYCGNPKVEVNAVLTPEYPINATCGQGSIAIGSKEQFTYRRRQIQATLKTLQIELKYCQGGKGRNGKLKAMDRYHLLEKNYVKTQMHLYSRTLVNFAKRHNSGVINLLNLKEEVSKAKEQPQELIIREWGYYGLQAMIEDKAKRENITVNAL